MASLLKVSLRRCAAYFGGRRRLAAAAVLLTVCLLAAGSAASSVRASAVRLCVVDRDGTEASAGLLQKLSKEQSLSVTLCSDEREGERRLAAGRAEGLLVIGSGYEASLLSEDAVLSYTGAASAYSQQAGREIIAGAVIAQRSRARAYQDAEELLGGLDAGQTAALEAMLDADTAALYDVSVMDGEKTSAPTAVFSGGYAGLPGFAALCAILLMLSCACGMARADARAVAARMSCDKRGRRLSFVGDFLAFLLIGLAVMLPAAVFGGLTFAALGMSAAYVFCVAGLCVLLGSLALPGRAEVLLPAVALISSAVGGCFADLQSVSGTMRTAASLTPQGQMLLGMREDFGVHFFILTAGGLAFAALGLLALRRKRENGL